VEKGTLQKKVRRKETQLKKMNYQHTTYKIFSALFYHWATNICYTYLFV